MHNVELILTLTGGFIAVQSLWTARWLTDVRLLDRTAVADDLMAMAIAFSAGSLLTGLIADWAERRGIGLKAVMIGCGKTGNFARFDTAEENFYSLFNKMLRDCTPRMTIGGAPLA